MHGLSHRPLSRFLVRAARLAAPLFAAPLLVACGNGETGSADMAVADLTAPADLTVVPDLAPPPRDPKDHPSLPAVEWGGGQVLKHIDVITIGWTSEQNDPLMQQREQFAEWYVQSPAYAVLQEYNVLAGTAEGPVMLKDPPPATLDDSAVGPTLIRPLIANGTLPMPTANTLYLFYLPAGVSSTLQGTSGCQFYGGYHGHTATGLSSPTRVAYAIIPHCVDGDSEFDSDTVVASHEIGEAATDPQNGGWVDPGLQLGEIGDLCTGAAYDAPLDTSVTTTPTDGGLPTTYLINRLYSRNAAMKGDSDPCLPLPDSYTYFNAAFDPGMDPNPTITLDSNGNATAQLKIEPYAFGNVGRIGWEIVEQYPIPGASISPMKGGGLPGSTQYVTVRIVNGQPGDYPLALATTAKSWGNVWYTTLSVQ